MQLYQLLKPLRGTRLSVSLSDPGFMKKQNLDPQQDYHPHAYGSINLGPPVVVEAVGNATSGRIVLAVANFGLRPLQLDVDFSALGATIQQLSTATLDPTSYRINVSLPLPSAASARTSWAFSPESVTVVQIFTAPLVQPPKCSVFRNTFYPSAGTATVMMSLTNFTPESTCVRTHPIAPGCVCNKLNGSRPLRLSVALPQRVQRVGQTRPTALFLQLGMMAQYNTGETERHLLIILFQLSPLVLSPSQILTKPPAWVLLSLACDDKTEPITHFKDSGCGRWRLTVGTLRTHTIDFSGGPFVQLQLPLALLEAAVSLDAPLPISLELMLNESTPPAVAHGNLTVVPPSRSLMFLSVVVETRVCT